MNGRLLDARLFSFISVTAAVALAAFFVLRALPGSSHPGAVATGLTLGLPLAYYLLLVRGRGWPLVSVGPVFLLCATVASFVIPGEHQGMLDFVWLIVPVVELGLVGYVMGRAYHIVRRASQRSNHEQAGDLYDQLRTNLRAAFDNPTIAHVLAYEVSVLYYALLFWRMRAAQGGSVYPYAKASGYGAIMAVVLLVGSVEIVAVHIILSQWSATAAWIHLGVTLYGLLWLWGDYQAARLRPIRIGDGTLYLRFGLRWDAQIPLSNIDAIEPATRRALNATGGDTPLMMTALGSPKLIVRTKQPVRVAGPYGFPKEASVIAFDVDDASSFTDTLEERLARQDCSDT